MTLEVKDIKVGKRVIFVNKNGWPGEAERAVRDGLKMMKTYIIDSHDIRDFSSYITLLGNPNKKFNSVMFELSPDTK